MQYNYVYLYIIKVNHFFEPMKSLKIMVLRYKTQPGMKASSIPHTTSVVPNTRRYICGFGFQPVHDTRGNT